MLDVANHWSTYQPRPRNHNNQSAAIMFLSPCFQQHDFVSLSYMSSHTHFFQVAIADFFHRGCTKRLGGIAHSNKTKNVLHPKKSSITWQNTQRNFFFRIGSLWSPCPDWPCCRSSCCPVFTRPKPSLHWAETGRPLLYKRAQHQLAVLPPSTSPQHRHLQLTRETVLIYKQPSLNCFIHFYFFDKL